MRTIGLGRQHPKLRKLIGGLSVSIFETKTMSEYLNHHFPYLFGYVGDRNRSVAFDHIVEEELRKYNLTDEDLAIWLTSKLGRWMMERVEGERMTVQQFRETVLKFFKKYPPDIEVKECKEET